MKLDLKILVLFYLILIGCQSQEDKISKLWIGKYEVSYLKADTLLRIDSLGEENILTFPDPESLYIDTSSNNMFFNFHEDSLTIFRFNETYYNGYRKSKFQVKVKNDSISFLDEDGDPFSMFIEKLRNDELELSYGNEFNQDYEEKKKLVFERLKRFNLGNQQLDLESTLISSPFVIGPDSMMVELTEASQYNFGSVITENLYKRVGLNEKWYCLTHGNELFLVFGESIIQIEEIHKEKIVGIIYGEIGMEIELRKDFRESKVNKDQLLGRWEQISTDKVPDRNLVGNWPYFEKRVIEIEDNTIIERFLYKVDTFEWELNKFGDKFLLKDDNLRTNKNYWKIIELSESHMKIERLPPDGIRREIEFIDLERLE